jgi:orotidine-5'-phosphate decarboxylase
VPAVDLRATARGKLIVALDVASAAEALTLVDRIGPHAGLFKVGLELFISAGPAILDSIRKKTSAGIFLDLKFHDIPATMRAARQAAERHGVRFLTVHCETADRLIESEQTASGTAQLLGVTVLTSVDQDALRTAAWSPPEVTVEALALRRAALARDAGCAGVVCSGDEVRAIRSRFGRDFVVVVPGIRPAWAAVPGDDQRRATTPGQAIAAGADYLVVGRPVRDAKDPAEAVERIVGEMGAAL